MIQHRKVSFKEWHPSKDLAVPGAEMLLHGCLRPLKVHSPRRTFARIEAELRKGRIVSTFADMTLLVLGPHHDSPEVRFFDEDMKRYNRRIA
jgi:hypothetical protein